jgi:hypothetical protein
MYFNSFLKSNLFKRLNTNNIDLSKEFIEDEEPQHQYFESEDDPKQEEMPLYEFYIGKENWKVLKKQ